MGFWDYLFKGPNAIISAAMILAFIGSIIAIICYLPGAIKVFKTHDTRGISLLMFVMTSFGCLIWVIVSILYIVGFASDKTDTDGLNHGLGVGLPTLLSNAGLGSCSIIIFIFKLKHVWYAKKNHIDLNEYVGNIVKERLNTNETNK